MKKYLFTLVLLLVISSIQAQQKNIKSVEDFKKHIKSHSTLSKSQAKTTAVYWRLSAYSVYDNMNGTTIISDSGKYMYSNARGSSFDFEYMEYEDYGVDGDYNNINADTCYKYRDVGSGFNVNEKYTSTYNSANLCTEFIEQSGTQLSNLYRELGTYDANGNFTVELYQDWNSSTSKWDDSYVSYYGYNTNNNIISDSSYDHDLGQPDVKGTYTYDVNGNLISSTYYEWNGSSWVGSYASQYQYDGNNRPVLAIYQSFNNGGWNDISKDSTTYTGGNTIYTTKSQIIWDYNTSKWVNYSMESRTFNANNTPATQLISNWVALTNQWEAWKELEHSYNQNGDIAETKDYLYTGGVKSPNYIQKTTYYYEVYFDVSVEKIERNKTITVYPNPTTSDINIVLNGKSDMQVSLINMTGQTVRTLQVTDNAEKATISTNGLTAGNYVLTVYNGNRVSGTQMITIQ